MTGDLAGLVERLNEKGAYGLGRGAKWQQDETCAEAAATIQRLTADLEAARSALKLARPYVQVEAARHVGLVGWVVPSRDALAAIDAALAPPEATP